MEAPQDFPQPGSVTANFRTWGRVLPIAHEGDWKPPEKLIFHSGQWVKMTPAELQEHGYPKNVVEEAILEGVREDEEVIEDDLID